jgi:hypothetical protein
MALTNDRRDEMLIDIHADVKHIKEQINEHHRSLYGADGNDGLSSRMQAVEIGQRTCPARHGFSNEATWNRRTLFVAWVGGISGILGVISSIVIAMLK